MWCRHILHLLFNLDIILLLELFEAAVVVTTSYLLSEYSILCILWRWFTRRYVDEAQFAMYICNYVYNRPLTAMSKTGRVLTSMPEMKPVTLKIGFSSFSTLKSASAHCDGRASSC